MTLWQWRFCLSHLKARPRRSRPDQLIPRYSPASSRVSIRLRFQQHGHLQRTMSWRSIRLMTQEVCIRVKPATSLFMEALALEYTWTNYTLVTF
ncbi:hypothetical protein AKJ16_DCAP01291 [Drosera capensis]